MANGRRFWWRERGPTAADIVRQRVQTIERLEARDRRESDVFVRLYEDHLRYTARGPFKEALRLGELLGFRLDGLNILASVVDAYIAKYGRNRPGIKVDTDNASYNLLRRANYTSEVLRAKLDQWDNQAIIVDALKDSLLTRFGVAKVTEHHDELGACRVPHEEIFVDPRGARYGKPREMFHRYEVNRHVLIERYPDSKKQILAANPATELSGAPTELSAHVDESMIHVYEAWHLPSGPDASDGVHLACTENTVLWQVEWESQRFPFAFLRHKRRRFGLSGIPLASVLFPMQCIIDKILKKIISNMHYAGDLIVLSREGTNVDVNKMGNVGKPYEVTYNATEPKIFVPDAFNAQQFQFLQWTRDQMYEISGVNQMLATGADPLSGDASGVARQEFWDQTSERLSQSELDYARFNLDLAEVTIDAIKRIHGRKKRNKATLWVRRWRGQSAFEQIDWNDVDMRRDQYIMALEPSNFVPDTRAGKLAIIEQLAKAQVVPIDTLSQLFGGSPDIDRILRRQNAARNHAEKLVDHALNVEVNDQGEITKAEPSPVPDDDADLEVLMNIVKSEIQAQIDEEAPESVLERLRELKRRTQELLDRASEGARQMAAEAQAAAPAPAADPAAAAAPVPDPTAPPIPGAIQ